MKKTSIHLTVLIAVFAISLASMTIGVAIGNKFTSTKYYLKDGDISAWRTYTNEEFAFEIKLPPKWSNAMIVEEYNNSLNANYINFDLEHIFGETRNLCSIVVQSYDGWASYKQGEVINKTTYIADYQGNVYSYVCGHEDVGFVDFPDYNAYTEDEVLRGNYYYDRTGGPFDEFINSIIPTFKIL